MVGDNAMGLSLHRSGHFQMAHFSGRRESFSMESDDDYGSVSGAQAAQFESDDSTDQSDSDLQQSISALESQLAQLKTSVDHRNRTRRKYTYLHNSNPVQMVVQPACPSCRKIGHLKGDRKCPALHSKCHKCKKIIHHWALVSGLLLHHWHQYKFWPHNLLTYKSKLV